MHRGAPPAVRRRGGLDTLRMPSSAAKPRAKAAAAPSALCDDDCVEGVGVQVPDATGGCAGRSRTWTSTARAVRGRGGATRADHCVVGEAPGWRRDPAGGRTTPAAGRSLKSRPAGRGGRGHRCTWRARADCHGPPPRTPDLEGSGTRPARYTELQESDRAASMLRGLSAGGLSKRDRAASRCDFGSRREPDESGNPSRERVGSTKVYQASIVARSARRPAMRRSKEFEPAGPTGRVFR